MERRSSDVMSQLGTRYAGASVTKGGSAAALLECTAAGKVEEI
jgi:hypothetical protein